MKIDYKFWYVKRDDAGFITEAAIRFYLGDITTQNEPDPITHQPRPVTRYRRTQRVPKTNLDSLGYRVIFDAAGNPAVLLTQTNFGQIQTDDELRTYCNGELAKFGIEPISEQT